MFGELGGRIGLVLLGALLVYLFYDPSPEVRYDTVIVTRTQIEEREPDTIVRWRERIVTRTIQPEVRAEAPEGAVEDVAAFCRASVQAALDTITGQVDTLRIAPRLLVRSVTHDPRWLWGKDRILLTGPTSEGDLVALDYEAWPGWSARASGDSLIFREPRFGIVKEATGRAVWMGLGAALCLAFCP